MSELVPIREAARLLRVSRGYLYRLPRNTPGLYQLGRSIRVDVDEIKDWARNHEEIEGHRVWIDLNRVAPNLQ
jgi:excisionase family DNA binding protein